MVALVLALFADMALTMGAKPVSFSRMTSKSLTQPSAFRVGLAAKPSRLQGCVRVTAFTDRGASGLDVKASDAQHTAPSLSTRAEPSTMLLWMHHAC